jgi:hypothetical protein
MIVEDMISRGNQVIVKSAARRGTMRFRNLVTPVAISIVGLAAPFIFTTQAQAAGTRETLNAGTNLSLCVSDNNNPPSPTNKPVLVLVSCNINNGYDSFYATPSSWGTGWYSIVSEDHTHSGSYCITGEPTKGVQMYLEGCNGGSLQAFKKSCQPGGTELVNAAGAAMNDYGGFGQAFDKVASWAFEQSPPKSLIFDESAHDMGTC